MYGNHETNHDYNFARTNFHNLQVLLESVNPDTVLLWKDPMSAQSKALEWLENDYNERNRGNDWRDLDRLATRYALAVLYFATDGGDSWNETYSFLSSSHECFWKKINGGDEPGGVLCDASFAVSGISMGMYSISPSFAVAVVG